MSLSSNHNRDNGSKGNNSGVESENQAIIETYSDLLAVTGVEADLALLSAVKDLDALYNGESNAPPIGLYSATPWLTTATSAPDLPVVTGPHMSLDGSRNKPTPTKQRFTGFAIPIEARPARGTIASSQSAQSGPSRDARKIGPTGRAWPIALGLALLIAVPFTLTTLLNGHDTRPQLNPASPTEAIPGNLPMLDASTTLSQTIDGYIVTIGPLPQSGSTINTADAGAVFIPATIADAGAVFIPYAVTNVHGNGYTESEARLVDRDNQSGPQLLVGQESLRWMGSTLVTMSFPSQRAPISFPRPDHQDLLQATSLSALVFDASTLQPEATEHALQLTLNLHISDTYLGLPGTVSLPPPPGETPTSRIATPGPFTFRFRLPFEPVHSARQIDQTIGASGVDITLKRVLASPREARIVLSFQSPDGGPVTRWQPVDTLLGGSGIERVKVVPLAKWLDRSPGLSSALGGHGAQLDGWMDEREWAGSALQFVTSSDFLDGGEWTLVIGALESQEPTPKRIEGPWVFRFIMPPFTPRPTPKPQVTYEPTVSLATTVPVAQTYTPGVREPFPTAPLPGPVETEQIEATPTPQMPMPIETIRADQTAFAVYPTPVPAPMSTPIPTPLDPKSAPVQLRNVQRLNLHPSVETLDLDVLNPPALSPQGDALLVSTRDHKLLLVTLDGSAPVKLADDAAKYAWSGDGRFVLYLHMEPMGQPTYITVPYSVSRDGQTRHRLDFEYTSGRLLPEITGDSTWERRSVGLSGNRLWRVPLDGSPAQFVVSLPNGEQVDTYRISPDGKRIVYQCPMALCLQDMDGSNWHEVEATHFFSLVWSHDSATLAALGSDSIFIYSRDGTLKRSIPYTLLREDFRLGLAQEETQPQWTADNRRLLGYVGSVYSTGRQSLVEIDADTGQVWRGLTPEGARTFSVSPDGRRLVLRGAPAEFWIADIVEVP
jgi:hypothetical protein